MKLFRTARCENKPFDQNKSGIYIFLEVRKMKIKNWRYLQICWETRLKDLVRCPFRLIVCLSNHIFWQKQ